jgi:hypothetical protein
MGTTAVAPEATGSVFVTHPITLRALGGVEGYTGSLSQRLDLGATYGVALGWDGPMGFLGMELGYSGSATSLQNQVSGVNSTIYRNGGYFDLLPGIPIALNSSESKVLRPYLLGGIGVDGYSLQSHFAAVGYQSKTVGSMPFGAGIEYRGGPLVVDARFNYVWEMASFSTYVSSPFRYQAQLSLGVGF